MSITKEEVKTYLSGLTVVEISELVKELEADWGVSAAAPVAAAAGGPAVAAEDAKVEEPTEFDVILVGFGDAKLQVIKEVRAMTGLGLKEAKALVDNFPGTLKEGISKADADEVQKKIEAAGGAVEIKPAA